VEEKSFDDILKRLSDLPSMPTIVQEMFNVMNMPNCSGKDVARVLEKDQALTVKILRMANSPFYGLSHRVDTVDRACTILGLNTLKDIALSVSMMNVFKSKSRAGTFDMVGMWKHGLGCAVAAKAVFELRYKSGDNVNVFVGGILHDIGKVILDIYMPDEYKKIYELYGKDMSLVDAEMYIIGITHALIGRLLAKKWNFTKGMEEMIAFHHTPALAKVAQEQVAAVHIGNEIAKALSLGKSNELFVMPIDEGAWKIFFSEGSVLTPTLEVILDEYTQIEEAFGLGDLEENRKGRPSGGSKGT